MYYFLCFFISFSLWGKSITGILSGKEEVTIKTKSQGEIFDIHFTEGTWVEKDTILATIDDQQEKLELEQAQIEFNSIEKEYKNLDKLKKFLSQEEYEQKKNLYFSKKTNLGIKDLNYKNAHVTTPISGIIARCFLKKGQTATSGEKAFDIVNNHDLVIDLDLTPSLASRMKLNQIFEFNIDHQKEIKDKATIFSISPVVDKSSGTIRVKMALKNIKNQDGTYKLSTGSLVNVSLPD